MRGVLAELEAAALVTLAGKGYQGSTYAKIPYKGKNKPDSQKQANKAHAKLRAPGERGERPAQNPMPLRACRKITRRFLDSGIVVWYARCGGNPGDAGGEVRGDLPASG